MLPYLPHFTLYVYFKLILNNFTQKRKTKTGTNPLFWAIPVDFLKYFFEFSVTAITLQINNSKIEREVAL
jgi:hypothetical protein